MKQQDTKDNGKIPKATREKTHPLTKEGQEETRIRNDITGISSERREKIAVSLEPHIQ